MKFSVQILGSNSALAAHGRHPTSQIVQFDNQLFLVDCGEGTQVRMSEQHIKRSKINQIFISHLHGDHYFGLIGLLTSYHLAGRKTTLTVFGPPMLADIIQLQLKASNSVLSYPIEFVSTSTDGKQLIFENDSIKVYSFPLTHRIPTTGFLFEEKVAKRRVNGEKTRKLNLQKDHYEALQNGLDIEINGEYHSNVLLTLPPYKSRSYAFCSDTIYLPSLVDYIKGVDLLYHEATFTKEAIGKATKTGHSTTQQAAEIAKLVEAKQLIVGHFSSKYIDLEPVLNEVKAVFPNSLLATEKQVFEIKRVKSKVLDRN